MGDPGAGCGLATETQVGLISKLRVFICQMGMPQLSPDGLMGFRREPSEQDLMGLCKPQTTKPCDGASFFSCVSWCMRSPSVKTLSTIYGGLATALYEADIPCLSSHLPLLTLHYSTFYRCQNRGSRGFRSHAQGHS